MIEVYVCSMSNMKSVSCRLHPQCQIDCQLWAIVLLTIPPCAIGLSSEQICDRNWFARCPGWSSTPYLAICLWRGLCLGHSLDWFADYSLALWSLLVFAKPLVCLVLHFAHWTDAFQTLSVYLYLEEHCWKYVTLVWWSVLKYRW